MVVGLDCLIMLIMSVCIIRLRWYEQASILDRKMNNLNLEDFTITIPSIPIGKDKYSNSPDILKAQLAVHLEDVLMSQP